LKLLVEVKDIRMICLVNYTPSNGKPIGISHLAIVNKAFSLISPLRAETRAKAYYFIYQLGSRASLSTSSSTSSLFNSQFMRHSTPSVLYRVYRLIASSPLYQDFFGLVVAVCGKLPQTVRSRRLYMVVSDSHKPRVLQQVRSIC
jgi:hypothetical protein